MGRQAGYVGWWADHDYQRRGVEAGVKEFLGWNHITEMMQRASEIGEARRGGSTASRDSAIVAFAFAGGFRISEEVRAMLATTVQVPDKEGEMEEVGFSGLRPQNVRIVEDQDPPHILFDGVMALKGYKKTDTWYEGTQKRFRTERKALWRTFPIPLDEPISKRIVEYLEERKDADFLFPITATRAYQILEEVEPSIWPHWFRAQRAAQLAREYHYDLHALLEFFQWKDMKTAVRYASMGYGGLLALLPKGKVSRVW